MTSAVIVAAGKGTRMKSSKGLSKQYIEIVGKPIILRTIEKFVKSEAIDEIIIVVSKKDEQYLKEKVLSKIKSGKPIKIAYGGKERFESSLNGINASSKDSDTILIHDAVRPFVKIEEIEKVAEKARKTGAAVLAVKSKDTVKLVSDGIINSTPDRDQVYLIQTPQGFSKKLLLDAYMDLINSDEIFMPTDDASVAERYGANVHVVEGSYENIKITTSSDIGFAESIIKSECGI
ncbi:2-C-methyl-D-erythritol 4-phosphate cytidylyltransferase [Proteocatella sphenisci]|uniref:2-C-methyl-D-erythritol 4-phosphate cytidylyltransferase n=1 Tax=Proteocatella sphenisci TaxID=181070 RepID=UPI00049024E1|nr:2-C-methyl-D-erythritol 4-phosphate cytidylyltransferase [Proteocatella sphenisci]